MSADTKKNLQLTFLEAIAESKNPLTIFLVNGIKLQGIVVSFDNYCIHLMRDGQSQVIYKHAISTIMPAGPQQRFAAEA